MSTFADKDIIDGILSHDKQIIDKIYAEYFPVIRKMVINNGGDTQHAKDIFQDALILIYRKAQTTELVLYCKFSTYLYAVCKKLWIQELKAKKYVSLQNCVLPDIAEEESEESDNIQCFKEVFYKHFNTLSLDCQKILRMHFNKATIDDIQSLMGYNTRHHTIDRKYRCKRSLIRKILNDPEFKNRKNEYAGKNRALL